MGRKTNTLKEKRAALSLAELQRSQAITTPEEMAKVTIPILICHGDKDYFNGSSCRGPTGQSPTAQQDFARLASYFPRGQLVTVPGDHGSAVVSPEFAKQMDSFLLAHK